MTNLAYDFIYFLNEKEPMNIEYRYSTKNHYYKHIFLILENSGQYYSYALDLLKCI